MLNIAATIQRKMSCLWTFYFCGKSVVRRPFVLSLHKHLPTHTASALFLWSFPLHKWPVLGPLYLIHKSQTHKHHTLLAQEVAHCISWNDVKVLTQRTFSPSNLSGLEWNGYPWFSNLVTITAADCMKMKHHRWDFNLWVQKRKKKHSSTKWLPKVI